ncbi:MAG: DUF302 domain-containing protein [Epsilonproteobacteria bacterium]|nr:hypothetical protein [Campylobacterota bacterium]NPA57627.1 DUF302 domain-containing protein [Campylobacterota bacterium]
MRFAIIIFFLMNINLWAGCHIIMKKSKYSFYKTLIRVIYAIKSHNLKTAAVIDFRKRAKEFGVEIPSSISILVSNPALESELVAKNPKIGVDLPLKIYIYEKKSGVFLTYHSPLEFKENYYIPESLLQKMEKLLKSITDYATR